MDAKNGPDPTSENPVRARLLTRRGARTARAMVMEVIEDIAEESGETDPARLQELAENRIRDAYGSLSVVILLLQLVPALINLYLFLKNRKKLVRRDCFGLEVDA